MMTPGIAQLADTEYRVSPLRSPVVVYGAGSTGRGVCEYLATAGYELAALLDANARAGQSWQGLAVQRPAEWLAKDGLVQADAVVAIHNRDTDMVTAIADVKRIGFRRVLNMVDFHNLFPEGQPFRYWLAPRSFYRPFIAEIERLRSTLADDVSRQWLDSVLAFRMSGDYGLLPTPSFKDQYCPAGIPRWYNPMRFVDCGAFDGDTVEQFVRRDGFEFEAIAAFEPDVDNFSKLATRMRTMRCSTSCFPCGVDSSTAIAHFQSGGGMASRNTIDGASVIQCVALDDALGHFRPTLIKMDVEGAEVDALSGARALIAESRPGLAISLYHEPDHLWQIPLTLLEWNLGYEFYIRGHAHNTFELVLYAIPSAR